MSFNDIIQNDAYDHILENILTYLDGRTIDFCRTVCRRLNKVVMKHKKSNMKLIKRIQFIRFLVHPYFLSIIGQISILLSNQHS